MPRIYDHNRILIVDDDEQIRFVLLESLQRIDPDIEIIAAENGQDALEKSKQGYFDIVITDIKMPKMDGIQLTEALQVVSPGTEVVWMTAFASPEIQEAAETLNVRNFLKKPLDISNIRRIARDALSIALEKQDEAITVNASGTDILLQYVQQLRQDTGASSVLLITTSGNLVVSEGLLQEINVSSLSALIAGNFLAANEIARMLGHKSDFRLSYHESDQHNVYAYGVGKDFLLVTVFGKETRPGVVWFYAQRTAAELEKILDDLEQKNIIITNHLTDTLAQDLEIGLENLFDSIDDSAFDAAKANAAQMPQ